MQPIRWYPFAETLDPLLFKILAAVDRSRYASVVMDTVSRIASFTECSVLILTVVDTKRPRKVQLVKEDEESIREFHKELIQHYFPQREVEIESHAGQGGNKLIPVQRGTIHSRTVEGPPADTICQWAENQNVDLVVVGKRGVGDASSAILGSVSENVVHKCRRSVLVAIREKSDYASWDATQASTQKLGSSE